MQPIYRDNTTEIDPNILYKVTHNLRGPLNSIIGLSNIALAESNNNNTTHYLEKIKLSAEKLSGIIDGLLNLSKITSTESSSYDKINFQNIIDDILNSLQYLPNYKKIDIVINIQQYVDFYSDSVVLYSVMQNIIENSIKYFDTDKAYSYLKIKIQVRQERTLIAFEDNGIGIEKSNIDKVTEMFVRGSESSTGNGIGLFIVKKSIEKLNGKLDITSQKGIGTTTSLIFENQ
ncbi:MAG: sensor histidine kinase [Cytophagales bacterium]